MGELTIYRNGTGHEEKQSESGKYELINLNSISIDGGLKPSGKFIDEETETLLKDDLVMVLSDVGHGDLLGRVAIIPENNRFVLNQRVALLRNNSSVDIKYLFSYINAHQIYFKKQGAGSSQLNISRGSVENFEVLLPHKDEQKKIGKYLSSIDHLITLHQCKCDYLIRLKCWDFSSLNKTAWEQRKLSELATMHARIGWQNLRTSEFLDSGDYMLITGTDFEDGKVNYSTCHYVEKERYEQDKNIQIKNGNILITKDGTLGKVAYVENLNMPATLNAGVFNVEVKDKNETDGKYLFQFLKAPFLMDYVAQKATGGTIKHLNQNILVNFSISIPSKAEQIRIGEYFSNLDNLITLHQRLYFWCKLRLIIRFL